MQFTYLKGTIVLECFSHFNKKLHTHSTDLLAVAIDLSLLDIHINGIVWSFVTGFFH